eukprot:g2559.t1
MARRSGSDIRDQIIGRKPKQESIDALNRPTSQGRQYLAEMFKAVKTENRKPRVVHKRLDLKGPKMHMTQRMWVEAHHMMHDELIANATSYVSQEVRRHEKVVKQSRALHSNDLHKEIVGRARKAKLDKGNAELLHLLHRVGQRKDQYHGSKDTEWEKLRKRRARATKRAKASAKAVLNNQKRQANNDILSRLVHTTAVFNRQSLERDYQKHIERVKLMGRVKRPKGSGRMKHKYDFDATTPKRVNGNMPHYHVEDDRFAKRWTKSKAYKQAVRSYRRAERADRRQKLKRYAPKRRKNPATFSASEDSSSESDY